MLQIPKTQISDTTSKRRCNLAANQLVQPLMNAAGGYEATMIQKEELLFNGAVIVLRKFLNVQECQDLISQAEKIGLKDSGYSHRIRKTDRVEFSGADEVARWMYHRAKPFLPQCIDLSQIPPSKYPKGIASNSVAPYCWYPEGLNPTLRICRYEPTGFFAPHHDGGVFLSQYHQSIQTFMLYLNDDFEGGETRFFTENQRHYVEADTCNIIHSYRPQAGDALIFNSCITHDGGPIISGNKYILRSELLYRAINEEEEDKKRFNKNQDIEPDHDPDVEFTWP